MSKPTVRYFPWKYNCIVVGYSALVIPVDHYAEGERYITNGDPIHTSTVLNYDPATGRFETRNTIYEELTA